jgi:hypothetical protein
MKESRPVDEEFAIRLMLTYRDSKMTELGVAQACMEAAGVWGLSVRELHDRLVLLNPTSVDEELVVEAKKFIARVDAHEAEVALARRAEGSPWGSMLEDAQDPNYGRVCGRCLSPMRAGSVWVHKCPKANRL